MKITILTYGSRGDVQPFIPLSLGLMARSHVVKLLAPARFKGLVEGYDIQFMPLAGDPAELSRHLNDSGTNFIRTLRGLMAHAVEIGADVLRQAENACSDADLIVHTFMHAVGAHTLAREKNIPDVHIQLFPMFTPTGDYPNITLPDLGARSLNRLTHTLSHKIAFWTSKIGYGQVRRRAGLARRKLYSPFDADPVRPSTPVLCAWSPSVLPPSSDWRPNVHVAGYFFDDMDAVYQPPEELRDFLAAGKRPVCVSFGSMLNRDARRIDRIVRDSLKKTKRRGIILSGWSDVGNRSSEDLFYMDAVPHQWLLPQCKMIIHHGGAGTTAAGLRAGIPNIIIPHTADQPFWGRRVHLIGAGPEPILIQKLSEENLSRAIIACDDVVLRKRAQAVGHQLQIENGVAVAANLIERYANDFPGRALQLFHRLSCSNKTPLIESPWMHRPMFKEKQVQFFKVNRLRNP
jgi:sterol 3beta-glucosyltransferase